MNAVHAIIIHDEIQIRDFSLNWLIMSLQETNLTESLSQWSKPQDIYYIYASFYLYGDKNSLSLASNKDFLSLFLSLNLYTQNTRFRKTEFFCSVKPKGKQKLYLNILEIS